MISISENEEFKTTGYYGQTLLVSGVYLLFFCDRALKETLCVDPITVWWQDEMSCQWIKLRRFHSWYAFNPVLTIKN